MKRRDFLKYSGLLALGNLPIEFSVASSFASSPILSGIPQLDRIKGGFFPGEVTIIGGRPSMGKTGVLLNLTSRIIAEKKQEVGVIFFSVEMSKEQMMMRLMANDSGVPISSLRSGVLDEKQFNRVRNSAIKLSAENLWVDDQPGVTAEEIFQRSRSQLLKNPRQIIVVDYLQLMRGQEKRSSRAEEVMAILRGLKKVAVELNVPVIISAQLNRGIEARRDRRPRLSDFREFTPRTQLDSVVLLYRDGYYRREKKSEDLIELHVAKNLTGRTGTAHVSWNSFNSSVG